MGWQRDARSPAGGRWECRAKRREYNQTAAERKREWARADYHSSPKNYLWHRRRDLTKQRAHIMARLTELNQEAEDLELES